MSTFRRPLSFLLAIGLLAAGGCAPRGDARQELEQGLTLYYENRLTEARPLFARAVKDDRRSPDALAWLAETERRLGNPAEAVARAEAALALAPCHAFAHCVLGEALNPMRATWEGADAERCWEHLRRAVACDSTDGNAWLNLWPEALRRGEHELARRALRGMVETGFLPPAVLAYNRWMLTDLPPDAVLITSGDMDTFPAVAIQEVEGFRTDVAVVNLSLLNTAWYARHIRDRHGVPLPVEDAALERLEPYRDQQGRTVLVAHRILQGWLEEIREGRFRRPLALSVTVDPDRVLDELRPNLQLAGGFWEWKAQPDGPAVDADRIRAGLGRIDTRTFVGPLASSRDRSPVRRAQTDQLVTNVTAAAIQGSEALIKAGRRDEALALLRWAEEFEQGTACGPVMADEIQALRRGLDPGPS